MATYRILVKEVWDRPDAAELNTCWVETYKSLAAARRRVNKIKNTDKWDCVGDWKLEVEGDIEKVEA